MNPPFWTMTRLNEKTGCLEFTGSLDKSGYGLVQRKGYPKRFHRAMWERHYGSLPEKPLILCHSCNNPCCGNVDHLYAGTHKDNTADMIKAGTLFSQKGRQFGKKLSLEKRAELINLLSKIGPLHKVLVEEIMVKFEISKAYVFLLRKSSK